MTDVQHQQNCGDASKVRFVLDKDRFYIIDTLNPAGPKTSHWDVGLEDQIHLREQVLYSRLHNLAGALIINLQEHEIDYYGNKYQPRNYTADSIARAIYYAICSSRLSALEPALSVQNRFDGTLKREKASLKDVTSLSLFRNDVERLLRDFYGDCEGDAMDRVLDAVLAIALEFTQFVRKDLYDEHQCAMDWDYIWELQYNAFSGSDHRRAHKALDNLRVRVREVRENPSAFSKYTVEFATHFEELIIMEPEGGCSDSVLDSNVGVVLTK
jgi:hypothetical protein